jgi:hypothetical protein
MTTLVERQLFKAGRWPAVGRAGILVEKALSRWKRYVELGRESK